MGIPGAGTEPPSGIVTLRFEHNHLVPLNGRNYGLRVTVIEFKFQALPLRRQVHSEGFPFRPQRNLHIRERESFFHDVEVRRASYCGVV
jgi:hypothetical protein